MRRNISAAALAVLLLATFMMVWALALPAAPEWPPFSARPAPTPPPTPAPTPTPQPPATPTPPSPTATTAPMPTATPIPTPTAPTPTPQPTQDNFFLRIDRPMNLDVIHGPSEVEIAGSTLPGSELIIIHHSSESDDDDDDDDTPSVDADGKFSVIIELNEGANVVAITAKDSSSGREARQLLQLTYSPDPPELYVVITHPNNNVVITDRVITVTGATLPGAKVDINRIIPAELDALGRWQAVILLQAGSNRIVATAKRDGNEVSTEIIVIHRLPPANQPTPPS